MFPFFKREPKLYYAKTYPECEFNIEGKDVFSIERDTYRDITLIGFTDNNGENVTWNLPISPQAHDALVRRFRAKIGQPAITKATTL